MSVQSSNTNTTDEHLTTHTSTVNNNNVNSWQVSVAVVVAVAASLWPTTGNWKLANKTIKTAASPFWPCGQGTSQFESYCSASEEQNWKEKRGKFCGIDRFATWL